MRGRRLFGLSSLCLLGLVLVLTPCGSVLLVYNTGQHPPATTRFEDVPAKKGFGPRAPEEGFAGRLEIAKPDIYACSPLDGPAKARASSSSSSSSSTAEDVTSTATAATTTTHSETHAIGTASRRGWGRLDGDATPRHGHPPLGGQILEAEELGEGEGEEPELPSAVLISRSIKDDPAACTFAIKVLNAQAAGFSAVVVYDSDQETMFQMSQNANSHYKPVEIPLVLVTHASGLALQTLIASTADPRGPEVYLDNADPFGVFVTVNLTMFMVVTGFMLALLTCGSMMVVTLHRYLRRYESLVASTNRPMSLPEVLQLPEICVEAGSRLDGDSCPVCLETFRTGDKLRNLPCQHAFHAGCITPWLTQRQRTCPMCKDPITTRPALSPARASSATTPSAVLSAPLMPRETASVAEGEEAGRGGGGGRVGDGGGFGGGDGDRLPLLSNSRGAPSDGGSIQETSPV